MRKRIIQQDKELKARELEIKLMKKKIDESRIDQLAEVITNQSTTLKSIKDKLEHSFASSVEKEKKIMSLNELQNNYQRQQALYLSLESNFNQVLSDKRLLEEEVTQLKLVITENKDTISRLRKDKVEASRLMSSPEEGKNAGKLKKRIEELQMELKCYFK